MKKIISLLLVLAVSVSVLTGCFGFQLEAPSSTYETTDPSSYEIDGQTPREYFDDVIRGAKDKLPGISEPDTEDDEPASDKPSNDGPATPVVDDKDEEPEVEKEEPFLESSEEISYLLIYNPDIYDSNVQNNIKKTTGRMSSYITPSMNRAEELQELPEYIPTAFDVEGFDAFVEENDIELSRADAFFTPYNKGDTRNFYTFDENMNRVVKTFSCNYAGTYCNIWVSDTYISPSLVEEYGRLCDQNIYNQTVELFGSGRFCDNGRKLNLFFTKLQYGIGGCFWAYDLFATGEVTPATIQQMGLNTDHAIIYVNADTINGAGSQVNSFIYTTMAHEFQHLINFTDYFYTYNGKYTSTWLNEAMSGFVEDYIYKDAQYYAGRYDALSSSRRIKHGQSLYNFDTDATMTNWDIGVYGSVYLFSEYVAKLANNDFVYRDLHNYWRTSYSSTLCDAEVLSKVIPAREKNRINSLVSYPSNIRFSSKDAEFMSKLTLDYYLSLLKYEAKDPEPYKYVDVQKLLYDEINPAQLEGGGRIIVELKNGSYEIPRDADTGLVYVGLNSNFDVITKIQCR